MHKPSPGRLGPLERALSFMRASVAATADAVRPIEGGIVVSAPSLPAVWAVNQVRVTEPRTFEELLGLAEEQMAGCNYRHIAVEQQPTGPRLAKSFRAAGWKIERDVIMVLSGPADRATDTGSVVQPGQAEALELIRRWYGDDESAPSEIEQLVTYSGRENQVLGDRLLGVRSGDDHLVAISKLRSDGVIAQVEDVYTAPEARGRGFARALITRASELARDGAHELIFIMADDNDWPKLLYERLGFRPVGHLWQFHGD